MSHVFISYSTRDAAYASRLAERLRSEGFNVWLDNTRLRSSEDWWRSIVLAIDACAAFIAVLSPASDQSKWVQREVTLADQRNKPIFPLLLAGDIKTPNWSLFVRTQYEDVTDGQLPDAEFYTKITEYAPRQTGKGQDITDPRMQRPRPVQDPVLQAALDNPPGPDDDAKPRPRALRFFAVLLLIILVGVIGYAIFRNDLLPLPTPSSLSAEQHFLLGVQASDNSDYDAAIVEFTRALDAGYHPQATVLTRRGDMHRYNDDFIAALADYDAALKSDPEFYYAHMGRAYVFSEEGEAERAIQNFELALAYAPTAEAEAVAWQQMGWLFYNMGHYDVAVDQFDNVLNASRDPYRINDTHYGLGLSYTLLEDFPAALEHLQEVIAADPDYADAYRVLGDAYYALEDFEAALQAYQSYVEKYGDGVDQYVLQRIQELEENLSSE